MVSVLVRVRPPSKTESKQITSGEAFECLTVENEPSHIGVKLKLKNKLGEWRTSEVTGFIDEQTKNTELFQKWIRPCISKVIDGYNLSVLCYGVTGAGKTHTMFGEKWEEGSRGVVYETAEHLLTLKEQLLGTSSRIHIEVSIFEIYNENIRDLSYPNPISLNCCEDTRGEVYVKDLRKFPVNSLDELRLFLQGGNSRRVKASTNKNMHSSRSHAIAEFTISSVSLNDSGKNDGNVKVGRLLLIDLAGSERVETISEPSTSSYPGNPQIEKHEIARKQEGAKINKSLLSLTNCILQLGSPTPIPGASKGYTNFRDSKLTRILKTSLGGNSKTIMIGCVCRSSTEYENTLNTLNYCGKAACIKKKEIQVVLKKTDKEIDSILNPPKMELFPANTSLKLSETKSPKKRSTSRIFGLTNQRSKHLYPKNYSTIMAKDFSTVATPDQHSANFSGGLVGGSGSTSGQGWDPSVFDEVKHIIRKDSTPNATRLIECMRKMIEEKKRLDELYRKQKITTTDYFHAMTTYNELSLRVLRAIESSYPQAQNSTQEPSNVAASSSGNTIQKRASTPVKSSLSLIPSSQRTHTGLKRFNTKNSYYTMTQQPNRPTSLGRTYSVNRPSSKAFSSKPTYVSTDTKWARKIQQLRSKTGKLVSPRGFTSKSPETLLSNRNSVAAGDDTQKLSLARQNYRNFKNEMKVVFSLKQTCDKNNPREVFEVGYKIDFLIKAQQENSYLLTHSQERMMQDLKDFRSKTSSRKIPKTTQPDKKQEKPLQLHHQDRRTQQNLTIDETPVSETHQTSRTFPEDPANRD